MLVSEWIALPVIAMSNLQLTTGTRHKHTSNVDDGNAHNKKWPRVAEGRNNYVQTRRTGHHRPTEKDLANRARQISRKAGVTSSVGPFLLFELIL